MKGKKTTAKIGTTKAAVKKRKKTAVKTSKAKAMKRGKKTTAKTSKTTARKKGKRKAEPQSSGMVSEGLVSKILDREQDQRRMLWQMAEEMSRLGGAIQHQHHILTDLVQHILQHPDRQLPSGAPPDEPLRVASPAAPSFASAESVPPNESAATEADADAALVSQEELQQLQDVLVQEQELVDRLHRPEAEDKSAATEADADAVLVSQEELQQLQDALVQDQDLIDRLRRHKAEDKSAAMEADADATLVPQDELLQLRDALEQEQALVERLRRSKLDLERRAVAAEAELDKASPAKRKSIWARLLGRDGDT